MENREITIEELQIGDEILTLSQQPKYLKVLEVPRKSKVPFKWRQGIDRYISVKCRVNVDIISRLGTKFCSKARNAVPYTYYNKEYNIKPPTEDSPIEKFDLNFKQIWLVKRETI
jgi:hypothetical protein